MGVETVKLLCLFLFRLNKSLYQEMSRNDPEPLTLDLGRYFIDPGNKTVVFRMTEVGHQLVTPKYI